MRVLLVDDERGLAQAVGRALELDGFAVDLAFNGVGGLHRALEGAYDVVVLDIRMPGLSGYDVVRRMREAEAWVPVLMLTAKDGEHDIADALDLGADDYLVKPFAHVVLVARLRALIRRGSSERPALLRCGNLTLDPAARRAYRDDSILPLTAREFALLEYLARNAGRVVPKSELMAHVWDEHFHGDPNIVEVHIRHLRQKIDEPFARAAIETVRGAGYLVRPDGG